MNRKDFVGNIYEKMLTGTDIRAINQIIYDYFASKYNLASQTMQYFSKKNNCAFYDEETNLISLHMDYTKKESSIFNISDTYKEIVHECIHKKQCKELKELSKSQSTNIGGRTAENFYAIALNYNVIRKKENGCCLIFFQIYNMSYTYFNQKREKQI